MRILDPELYLPDAAPEDRRRARRLLIHAAALAAQAVPFGLFFLVRDLDLFATGILAAILGAAVTLIVLRATRSTLIAGNWLHLHLTLVLCWFTYHTAVQGPAMIWFVTVPLLALMTNGHRAGIVWGLVSGACVTAAYALQLAGHPFPQLVDSTSREWLEWMSVLSVIGGTFWVVATFERQQERSHRGLRDALAQADAASRVKSAFLANTSHELRTPMNGVVGMTSLLMTTDLSGEQREYVETIHESAESLLSVIDDILDFSQLEADKLRLVSVEFDVRQRLEMLIALLRERIGEKPLALVASVDGAVPERLVGDPVRFNQVITNLVDNALKFTDRGEVVVEVRVAKEEGAAIELAVSVKDGGIGIAQQDRERIFERFMQLDSSSARRYGGTGLGLAISKQLVERMGGRISVESELGRGSTFRFSAKFERGAATEDREERKSACKILVVEDNAVNQLVAATMIQRLGYGVDVVASGSEALVRCEENQYGAIVMDCHMPGMDGFETAAEIRRRENGRGHTPIIALTASAASEYRTRCLAAGMDDFLNKPVELETMQTILGRWVRG